jgi:hypothetical protein
VTLHIELNHQYNYNSGWINVVNASVSQIVISENNEAITIREISLICLKVEYTQGVLLFCAVIVA